MCENGIPIPKFEIILWSHIAGIGWFVSMRKTKKEGPCEAFFSAPYCKPGLPCNNNAVLANVTNSRGDYWNFIFEL